VIYVLQNDTSSLSKLGKPSLRKYIGTVFAHINVGPIGTGSFSIRSSFVWIPQPALNKLITYPIGKDSLII
jgi:hypothetical protein